MTIIVTFLYDRKKNENVQRDRKCEGIIESKGIIEPLGSLKLRNPAKVALNKVIFFCVIGLPRANLSALAKFSSMRF